MRYGLTLIAVFAFAGVSGAQKPAPLVERLASSKSEERIAALRDLGKHKVNLNWLVPLTNSLKNKDRLVVRESLRVWAKMGRDYDQELGQYESSDEGDWTKIDVQGRQAWHQEIVSCLSAIAERHDEMLRKEALRTMCKLSTHALEICPPARRCGTGANVTLWFKVRSAQLESESRHRAEYLALLNDDDPDVVYGALRHLGKSIWKDLGHRATVYLFSSNKEFRAIGMWMLGDAPFLTKLHLVGPLLDDKDEDIRLTASVFFTMSEDEARRLVVEKPARSINLRVDAISKTGYEPTPARDAILKRLLTDASPEVRNAALEQLGEEGLKGNLFLVRRGLDDPSPIVKATALRYASRLAMPGLLPYFRSGLLSQNRDLREAALSSAPPELTVEMIRAVDLGVSDVWQGSPDFDNPKFAYLVNQCLNSKNPDVRQLLCYHYGSTYEGTKPVELMVRLALDPDPEVARMILYDLASLPDQKAYQAIVTQTSSKHFDVRIAAIGALGHTKRASALPILQMFLTSEDREVRRAVKYAVKTLQESLVAP